MADDRRDLNRARMVELLGKELVDSLIEKGLLVEAGWLTLKTMAWRDAPEVQAIELRMAFFAGAQHVFGTIMTLPAMDEESAEAGGRQLDQIGAELEQFITEFKARFLPAQGEGPKSTPEEKPAMADDRVQTGRLALRVEGEWWVAYYALPDSMHGAIELGRIQMALVEDETLKSAFMDLMRSAVAEQLKAALGSTPEWGGAKGAPFWERKPK